MKRPLCRRSERTIFGLDSANDEPTPGAHEQTKEKEMAYATETRAAGGPLLQKVAEFRAFVADRFARYQVYRETMGELTNLSDRDLADLGIARGDIHRLAVEAAYGR